MKEHFCPVEQSVIAYVGQCNWCGQKEWVGLTEEDYASPEAGEYTECFEDGARWAEIKLKEKNT